MTSPHDETTWDKKSLGKYDKEKFIESLNNCSHSFMEYFVNQKLLVREEWTEYVEDAWADDIMIQIHTYYGRINPPMEAPSQFSKSVTVFKRPIIIQENYPIGTQHCGTVHYSRSDMAYYLRTKLTDLYDGK